MKKVTADSDGMVAFRVVRGSETLFDLVAPNEDKAKDLTSARLSNLEAHGLRILPSEVTIQPLGTVSVKHAPTTQN